MFKYHKDLICYNQTDIAHDQDNLFFLDKHSTNEGTWGLFQLTGGEIEFIFVDGEGHELSRHYLNPIEAPVFIPPAAWHKIQPISEAFYGNLEFYCKPHRYFSKKHRLNEVHSDLLYVYQSYLQDQGPLDILDIGCGVGRNALFLALQGHSVHGIDINESSLRQLMHIAHQEKLSNMTTSLHDLNQPMMLNDRTYDWIISTVSLQFLQSTRIPSLLSELQQATRPQGVHFLVFPIESENFTLPSSFTFMPESEELLHFYQDQGWAILEYKETVGRLHRLDEFGRPIQGIFGHLLAQKPAA
ncbi:SAM-dependent methyltransferase TehB [Legionella impletisoli]|uniref:SAM-dependent methyltransferase TehB n=1 Tax=Legionella impletisoli TaxID=343510 RepID=A0A917N8U6_9GAMM|nr:SAM-dependent methyltransferase TehB [Legionella impletisoli]GGI77789.1 SAM-dependent methyltransferase TehB [Legionella impletisoli]